MKKLLLILVLAVMCSSVARADDFVDGVVAYGKGDYVTALKLLRPSADRGDVMAQVYLAQMYSLGGKFGGKGVIQDYKEAAKWYHLSAEKGVVRAQYNLGVMYDKGQGVIQDYVLAHMWYNISASNGNDDGRHNRDSIAKEMTPAQIYKAKNMARECVKKNYKNCD